MRLSTILKPRSVAELRFRARQTSHVLAERLGMLPGQGEANLLANAAPRLPFSSPREVVPILRARWPEHVSERLRAADALMNGTVPLLGFEIAPGQSPERWRTDPVTGQVAPQVHWSRVPYLDATVVGDHKRTWELNRHQHLVVLGQAYALTGDARYVQRIADELESWLDANPPKVGINWTSALELSLRAIAWLWTLHLVGDSEHIAAPLRHRVLASLAMQLLHVEANLSSYFSPNTHLTGEALALVYGGVAFGDSAVARRLRELGESILRRELQRQLRPDGTYFEQSSWYQRYTADFGLHFLALSANARRDSQLRERLTRATDVLRWISRPDLTLPLVGDDDGGSLLPLESRASSRSIAATLGLAGAINEDATARALVGDCPPSVAWMLGDSGVQRFDQLRAHEDHAGGRAFTDGGTYVARSGWTADANMLTLDGGPHGDGAHGHADALSLELVLKGQPVIVDPGTLSYVTQERDELRGTMAHSTVSVGQKSSSTPRGLFGWSTKAESHVWKWAALEHDRGYIWTASHDGYAKPNRVRVERSVFWLHEGLVVVSDLLEGAPDGAGVGGAQSAWQLDAGWNCTAVSESMLQLHSDAGSAWIRFAGAAAMVGTETAIVSPAYGVATSSTRAFARAVKTANTVHFFTIIGPAHLECVTVNAATDAQTAAATIRSDVEVFDIVLDRNRAASSPADGGTARWTCTWTPRDTMSHHAIEH